jgi:hypothetical protein
VVNRASGFNGISKFSELTELGKGFPKSKNNSVNF